MTVKDAFSKSTENDGLPVTCLALDIGGVFYADVWETLFQNGLAAHCGLDIDAAMKHGARIWNEHGNKNGSEEAYWQSWEAIVGRALDRDLIATLADRHVWVDMSVVPLIENCLAQGIDVCFVSNSTPFWFERQMQRTGLHKILDRIPGYLSHEIGCGKTHPNGGLTRLAQDRDPSTILFVDDRKSNTDKAAALGMRILHYTRKAGINLAQTLEGRLFKPAPCAADSVPRPV